MESFQCLILEVLASATPGNKLPVGTWFKGLLTRDKCLIWLMSGMAYKNQNPNLKKAVFNKLVTLIPQFESQIDNQ